MNGLRKVYSILLMIIIPVLIVLIGLNFSMRSQEVFSYYLNDSQALDYTTLSLSSNELSEQLSDFSWGLFSDEIDITENAGYMDDPVFDDTEAEVLFDIRDILTKSFLLMMGLLGILVILYIYFIKKEYKDQLFFTCKVASVISIVASIVTTLVIASDSIVHRLYESYIGISLGKDSILRILFTKGDFAGAIAVAQLGIGLIALGILFYITWRLTKPPRIYQRRW